MHTSLRARQQRKEQLIKENFYVLQIHHLLNILYGKLLSSKYVEENGVLAPGERDSAGPVRKRQKMEGDTLDSVLPRGFIKVMKSLRMPRSEESSKEPDIYVKFVLKKRLVVS